MVMLSLRFQHGNDQNSTLIGFPTQKVAVPEMIAVDILRGRGTSWRKIGQLLWILMLKPPMLVK